MKEVYVVTVVVGSEKAAMAIAAAALRAKGTSSQMVVAVDDQTATRADPRGLQLKGVLNLTPEEDARLCSFGLITVRDVTELDMIEVWRRFTWQGALFGRLAAYMAKHKLTFAGDESPLPLSRGYDTLINRPGQFMAELEGPDITQLLRTTLGEAGVLSYDMLCRLTTEDVASMGYDARQRFIIDAARGALNAEHTRKKR